MTISAIFQKKTREQRKFLDQVNTDLNNKREQIEKKYLDKNSKEYSIEFYNLILNYESRYISGHRNNLFTLYKRYFIAIGELTKDINKVAQECEKQSIGRITDEVLQEILRTLKDAAKNLDLSNISSSESLE